MEKRKKHTSLYLPEEQMMRVKAHSALIGVRMSTYIEAAINEKIKRDRANGQGFFHDDEPHNQ